jgi:hypothetical protein
MNSGHGKYPQKTNEKTGAQNGQSRNRKELNGTIAMLRHLLQLKKITAERPQPLVQPQTPRYSRRRC